jgi:hypothetical protein
VIFVVVAQLSTLQPAFYGSGNVRNRSREMLIDVVFPEAKDSPPLPLELGIDVSIARSISADLGSPKRGASLGFD